MRGTYVLRELGYGIRRNITLFVATIITVIISLTLVGGGLVISRAVESATERWSEDIEFIVFMNPEASAEQNAEVAALVDPERNPEIRRFDYVDQAQAYQEFLELFEDTEGFTDNVTPDILPPSYRVVPVDAEADVIQQVADQFKNKPGVLRVVLATDVIRQLQDISETIAIGLLLLSIVLLLAAALLVFNTIRTVIFARRREIEVMKLVGASNWYIRFPFMIEGTLQGVLGGILAIPGLFAVNRILGRVAGENDAGEAALKLLDNLEVARSTVLQIGLFGVIVGAVIGALASLIAITRFLDV